MKLVEIIEKFSLENPPERATDKNSTHCYVEQFYETAFSPYQDKNILLLEIGISNGASLKLWREYFQNAEMIIGIDNRPEVVHPDFRHIDGVTQYYFDAYNEGMVRTLSQYDIIIDDGCHDLPYQKKALELYLPHLKKGGIYVVEDIHSSLFPNSQEELTSIVADNQEVTYEWIDLRSFKNRPEDNLFVVRK